MSACINKNSIEYQSLKNRANISEFVLEAICRDFLDKYGRFPHLDELPNSNSESHLKKILQIKSNGGTKVSNILDATNKGTVEEAVIDINNNYRDLETRILPIQEEAIVDIVHRPTTNNFEEVENIEHNIDNSFTIFNKSLMKLANLYGIQFNEVTDAELNSDQWNNLISSSVNAFVYNGQIYINTDRANIDAPIHEMFHILVGSMRFENPELYSNLVNSVMNLSNYNILAEQFPNRTQSDINEEIFITELAYYFAGLPSQLTNLDQRTIHELTYNIKRTLDTILMGQDSVKTISNNRLFNMSLKDVIKEVNSKLDSTTFKGFINVEGSSLHRKLNNIKSDLLKNNQLIEICD